MRERLYALDAPEGFDARIEECFENMKAISSPWEEVELELRRRLWPGRGALITLVGTDENPEAIWSKLRRIIPDDERVHVLDVGELVFQKKGQRPGFWQWIQTESGSNGESNAVVVVRGFENCHAEYDDLLPNVTSGVDTFGSPFFPDPLRIILLPDKDFYAYLLIYDWTYGKTRHRLVNRAGFYGRTTDIVVSSEVRT